VNFGPQLSAFGDFPAHILFCNLLKTQDVRFGDRLAILPLDLQENVVIIIALLAAVILLVAVTFISSIDFSGTRRH
jgi:hypothetical protein